MKNEKIYAIYKKDDQYDIGYYYPPKTHRELKRFITQKQVLMFTDGYYQSLSVLKTDIIKRHKSEKYLKKHYPQYFI